MNIYVRKLLLSNTLYALAYIVGLIFIPFRAFAVLFLSNSLTLWAFAPAVTFAALLAASRGSTRPNVAICWFALIIYIVALSIFEVRNTFRVIGYGQFAWRDLIPHVFIVLLFMRASILTLSRPTD